MKHRNLILGILMVLLCSNRESTGPSYIESEIKPISRNEKGEILCKTRFTKNQMGAHSPMPIQYGFCVITKKEIKQFNTIRIDPGLIKDDETFYQLSKYWDGIFHGETNVRQLMEINQGVLESEGQFTALNVKPFQVDLVVSIPEFEKNKKTDLQTNKQKGLYGATGVEYYEAGNIHIVYDFGDILILENKEDDYDESRIGARFDYSNPWTNRNGEEVNIGFAINLVTGVLRLNV